ncbi:hypothetical protein [Streptomyces cucumeris]|uniref:hypothetical protein n=1 Tax=Streptomyces cucumeris TaxID=2962890 RepID=UPI003EBAA7DA
MDFGITAAIERQERALRSHREPGGQFADGQALRKQLAARKTAAADTEDRSPVDGRSASGRVLMPFS